MFHARTDEKRPIIFGCIDFFSGSVASAANVLVGYPLDTVKVKMQTYPELYSGPFRCLTHTVEKFGVKKLYSGLFPALFADFSEKSVLFCAYGYSQFLMNKYVFNKTEEELRRNKQNGFESAICGSIAGFFSSITLCPTEMIKCKMQALHSSKHSSDANTFQVIKQIYKGNGLIGFYKGLHLTIIRELPGYFFYFGGYTVSCNLLGVDRESTSILRKDLWKIAVSGGVGGVCLWLSCYPFDLFKTKVQVQMRDESIFQLMKETYQGQGISGFYRGLTPTLIRCFPAAGSLFVVYEVVHTTLTNEVKTNKRYEFLLKKTNPKEVEK